MPFSFSHPAIVLPLAYLSRKWFSITGLVIGSMTPDFEYFIRMRIKSDYSHTIPGLFWFDLPLGILLAFIFHNIIRDALFDNLPTILKSRVALFKQFNWNQYFKENWLVVVLSVLIGAASHVFWDSFTHHDGYFVELFPSLQGQLSIGGFQIYVCKILQHLSTIFGGLVVLFALWQLPINTHVNASVNANLNKQNTNTEISLKYWILVFFITFAIIGIRFMTGLRLAQYGNVIVTAMSAGMLALIFVPLIERMYKTPNNNI